MPRRWLRGMFVVLVTLAAWLVARPSFASTPSSLDAPLCDDRGATVIARPPTLVTPQTSIDVAAPDPECPDGDAAKLALRGSGEGPSRGPATSAHADVEAVLPLRLALADAVSVGVAVARASRIALPAGIRGRVDRPPRARA